MSENKIVVVGIFVVDLAFVASKLPLPGETIIGDNYIIGPGGKGSNQSVVISRTGAKVSLIARIGDDEFAVGTDLYKKENVYTEGLITAKGEKTGSASISIDKTGMNSIIVVPGVAFLGLNQSMIDEKIASLITTSTLQRGFEVPLEIASYCLMRAKSSGT